jgi:tetratricopeptide (TPR) repeat protein
VDVLLIFITSLAWETENRRDTLERFDISSTLLAFAGAIFFAAGCAEVQKPGLDAGCYFDRGLAHSDKGQYDEAISDCSKALQIDRTYASAYKNVASLFATCPDDKYLNGVKE